MKFRKAAIGLSVLVITNIGEPTIQVLANEISRSTLQSLIINEHISYMEAFTLESNEKFSEYVKEFKIARENIESLHANGGQYSSSSPERAVDENASTHWETGKANNSTFKNEFTVTFKEVVNIDKITYKVRQDSGTKGFLKDYEIYGSLTADGDDFTLITKGSGEPTKNTVEIKFNETNLRRVKIKFVNADREMASISELGFYKKDTVRDAIDNLFTNSNKNEINEEYKNINKLNELENLAKEHPLYSDYKNIIEDAKVVISDEKITSSEAKTKQFIHFNNSEYNELFKMDNSNIKSIKNNAGHYASRVIGNAIDGDVDTYWETNKSNSSDFTNEVEIEFNNEVVLNRIVYGTRQSDAKGFAEEFEIYASTTSKGDTFELVSVGSTNKTTDMIEAQFEPTKFKRLKFKFKKSNQNWASARKIIFYKEDKLKDEIYNMFIDKTYSELKEEYKNIDKINELTTEANNHPLKDDLLEIINMAKFIINGKVDYSNTILVANQHGDMASHARNNLQMNSFGQNLQATGLYALPGDKITVYLEVDVEKDKMPVLQFSQNEGYWKGWRKGVRLQPGKNEIIVPSSYLPSEQPTNPKAGGAIYIENPYTPEEQGKAPIIRIEGAERFPFYKEGDDEEEFKAFLIEYKKRLDEDNKTGADKVLDILAVESDRMLISGTTTGAYDAYITKGINPCETTTFWDETMEEIFRYYGLDGSSEIHNTKYIKEHIMFVQPYGYMYAWTDHVGVQKERLVSVIDMNDYKYLTNYDWKSASQSYSTTRKDNSASNKSLRLTDENNNEVVYERGIGAHATATIIYDLSDKAYKYFTSFVGVDREMYNRPGSLSFEVYVDGVLKYDSGLMLAKDPQKFIEVDINGAKELKLVVKDGRNGNDSDHATWGDTKLHFVNEQRADLTILKETLEKAENIDRSKYTEDSVIVLETTINTAKEIITENKANQDICDKAVQDIENAINNLVALDTIVEIEDEFLLRDIKRTLGINDVDITIGHMNSLTTLTCETGYVKSLKGLEHAVNLESLNIDYNEVNDISTIKNLKKLNNFSGLENFIMKPNSDVKFEDGKFIIEDVVIDFYGERLLPKEVVLSPRNNPVKLNLEDVLDGNKVVIDANLIDGTEEIEVLYESNYNNYQLYTFLFLTK